ncbi:MAG TPA: glycosyltransferase [Roseiarcus sp.]|nr:glycosyltransferase [Roseiarcus sp.]
MLVLSGLSLAVWLYLIFARGGFWLAAEREADAPAPAVWPEVVAVIPARDEADTIAATLGSLLRQDYPGLLRIVLVDDESSDGTSEAARRAAGGRLEIIAGTPTPAGWSGKLWAVAQGVAAAGETPRYLLLTDADIAYAPGALAGLVAGSEAQGLGLNSLMARLACASFPERVAIPAFILFFQMLYPFAWVNAPGAKTAAAAGGCMLVRREALAAAGGVAAIRGALIDDCALARLLKAHGPIRLRLAERVASLRRYRDFIEIRRMVVRSAYAQLNYSPALLVFTLAAMVLVFIVPVAAALFAQGGSQAAGLGAWALMATAFQPTLRCYRVSPLWGFALPAIAALYAFYTLESGLASARGEGGLWKGRYQERTARR